MSVDGPERVEDAADSNSYLAGSQALDALDRLVMSTESFFHPSNSGPWSLSVSKFLPACHYAHVMS